MLKYWNEYIFKEVEGGIAIVGHNSYDTHLNIPEEIDGKKVVSLGVCGKGNRFGVDVTIPDTVSYIDLETMTFRNYQAYEKPDRISWINELYVNKTNPYFAVKNRILYTKDLKKIIFCFSVYDIEKLSIPEGTEIIGEYAFSKDISKMIFIYGGLEKVTFPESLKRIEEKAFYNRNLKDVEIPENVEYVGDQAFAKHTDVKICGDNTLLGQNISDNISIAKTNKKYHTENGLLLSNDNKRLLKVISENDEIQLPDEIEVIDCGAISRKILKDDKLPLNLKWIGENNKIVLTGGKLFISNKVEYIGTLPVSANKIVFEEGNKNYRMDKYAVYHILNDGKEEILALRDHSIDSFEVNEKIACLDKNVFYGCDKLKKLKLNEGLLSYDEQCVEDQFGDKQFERIYIPSSVKRLSLISSELDHYRNINYLIDENNSHYFIDDDIIYEIGENDEYKVLLNQNRMISKAVIDDGTISIEDYAFYTKEGLQLLKEIEIPDSVRFIQEGAFRNCKSLTKVNLPENLEFIDIEAFAGCDNLQEFSISNKNKHYSTIDGVLFDKEEKTLVIYPNGRKCEKYEMPNSVEEIGGAFSETTCIKELVLSEGLKRIKDNAFPSRCGFRIIQLKNDIKDIGLYAFGGPYDEREKSIQVYCDPSYYFNDYVMNDMKSSKTSVIIVDVNDSPETRKNKQLFSYKKVKGGLCLTSFLNPNEIDGDPLFEERKEGNDIYLIRKEEELIIPSKIGEERVVEIGEHFLDSSPRGIRTITISEGLEKINKYSLFNTEYTRRLNFPASVNYIDKNAFVDKDTKYKDLYLDRTTINVVSGSYAEDFFNNYDFKYSTKLIVDGVDYNYLRFTEKEGEYTAEYDEPKEPVEEINIPSEYNHKPVTIFVFDENDDDYLFYYRIKDSTKKIYIGENISKIVGLYQLCRNSKDNENRLRIEVDPKNKYFWSDGVALYSKDKKKLLRLVDHSVEKYEVVPETEVIEKNAFNKCETITQVTLSENCKTIKDAAFCYCSNLKTVIGIERVNKMGKDAFSYTKIK